MSVQATAAEDATESAVRSAERPAPRRGGLAIGPAVPATLLVLFLALPLVGLILHGSTPQAIVGALGQPVVLQSLWLSLVTTVVVLVLALVLGTPLALILARGHPAFPHVLETLVDLPMVLPPAVAGLALLMTLGRRGLLGGALDAVGIELPFTTAAVVLAQVFVAVPFYVRAARSGFVSVPREVEEAAMTEGASGWQVFRHVTAPLASPALLGGLVLCWARALGEFGATIMFAGNFQGKTQTMPLAIYSALENNLDAAVTLSLVLLGISAGLLLAFRRWVGRDLGGM